MCDAEKPEEPAERCHCDDCERWERLEHPAEVDWTEGFMTTLYTLEVYEAGSARNVLATFESVAPFAPINVGELVNTAMFRWSYHPQQVLRVVGIEHIIWSCDEKTLMHKICVFTVLEENTPQARFRQRKPGETHGEKKGERNKVGNQNGD